MIPEFSSPEWVHHAVFYQIFPDRFASSPRVEKPGNLEPWDSKPNSYGFKGGDLLGVCERLDYLQDLGVNAIYFTPIFQSAANHRYHTHDYWKVDPLLGGDPAFHQLFDEAHRRGMHVILDGVFNHASRGFFQFHHILENGASSPYIDWFRVNGFPLNAYDGKPNYDAWLDLPALPEFNHANPQVRRFIFDVARYWIEQGADGWRLDVPFWIEDPTFWQEFRQAVKGANADAYITGEIPMDASPWLQGDMFDGVMNYMLSYACWGFFGGEDFDPKSIGGWMDHAEGLLPNDAPGFGRQVGDLLRRYPQPAVLAQLNLLDSHDSPRFLTLMRGDKARQRLAVLFQMTYPGAPCVYYGDEIGMEGGEDPDNRRAFPWDEGRWDEELRGYYQRCIALRKAHRALRDGEFAPLLAEGGVFAYLRSWEQEKAVIVLNRTPSRFDRPLETGDRLSDGSVLEDQLGAGGGRVARGRFEGISVPPMSGAVYLQR